MLFVPMEQNEKLFTLLLCYIFSIIKGIMENKQGYIKNLLFSFKK